MSPYCTRARRALVVAFALFCSSICAFAEENDATIEATRRLAAQQKPKAVQVSNVPWTSVPYSDPFIPAACSAQAFALPKPASVSVVIPARNEDPAAVRMTVQSVLANSGSELRDIWVVDDLSAVPLEAKRIFPDPSMGKVNLLRNSKRLGVAGSKAKGAEAAIEHGAEVVVFLDAHCVVSDKWLRPILGTLSSHPRSLVYPGLDAIHPETGKLLRGEEAVATLDLTLELTWRRVKQTENSEAQPQLSPVAPGILALTSEYYTKLGGMPSDLYPFGLDAVDLSLKSWLCGGGVIREPCSRVAHAFWNLRDDVYTRNGVTEMDVHRNALIVAGTVMGGKDMENLVRKARFAAKPAFDVDIPTSVAARMYDVRKQLQCQSFDWFVDNLAPNLRTQMADVQRMWTEEANKARTAAALAPLLQQYTKPTEIKQEATAQLVEDMANKQPGSAKAIEEAQKRAQQHNEHMAKVKNGLCEDFDSNCAVQAELGECTTNPGAMIFLCPKSCNLCDVNGKYCSDFYLNKCPMWAREGKCDTDQQFMHYNCRHSCKLCVWPGEQGASRQANAGPLQQQLQQPLQQQPQQPQPQQQQQAAWDESQLGVHPYVDPYTAHRAWQEGTLSDPAGDGCSMKSHHKAVLKNVQLATLNDEAAKLRVLCISYTTEDRHKTSIAAIRSTWAKRCDGHLVISTKDDGDISAAGVPHKGKEEYNNIWQKIRAGWAYVARHYQDSFDWFYIGGDDVFLIVENLKTYLASEEIVEASKDGTEPMFVGRRFKLPSGNIFNSGGAGYALNRAALKLMQTILPECRAEMTSFAEDVMMAECFRQHAGLLPFETKDTHGRERFHPFTPGQHYTYRIPTDPNSKDWYAKYSIDLKEGAECCSEQSISFHYADAALINEMYGYLYTRTTDC